MTGPRRAASRASIAPLVGALLLALPAPATAQDAEGGADVDGGQAQETVGVHTVRRGDTLWDLAARFLSNPLRWPAIFELNPTVVEDPHWIYPGEQLRIPGARGVTRVDRDRVETTDDYLANLGDEAGRYPASSIFRQPPPGARLLGIDVEEGPPQPVVTGDDFRRAPILVGVGELGPEGATVRVIEENPLDLALRSSARQYTDVVIALGGLEPAVGDTLKAVRRVRTEPGRGEVVVPMALLEVSRLWADSARAAVVRQYADYAVGDPVVRIDEYALDPAARGEPVAEEVMATVIAFEVPQVLVGLGEAVFLDRGRDDGAAVGDEYAVFSRDERGAIESSPEDALAILRVVHVTPATSTTRVVSVRDPGMRPGDPALLVVRLPSSAFTAPTS